GSGRRVVLEEFLAGEEVSVMAVCDGREAVLLPSAHDYKRAGDGDSGPNTGGMGAFAPAEPAASGLDEAVLGGIVRPVLAALAGLSGAGYRYRRDIAAVREPASVARSKS